MAQTSGTLWYDKTIVSKQWNSQGQLITPQINSTATYECDRVGTTLKIKVNTTNYGTSSGTYWDWRWAFSVSVNGQPIASNIQIKPRTYLNTIGTTHYSASTGWCEINIGAASQVEVAVSYFDTQAYDTQQTRRGMGGGTVTLGNIPQLPGVSISQNSKTHNSISVNYSAGSGYDYVKFYVNGNDKGNFSNSPVNLTGLSPNTTYTIKAKAHGNGGFGNESNVLTIKTYLTPSTVSSSEVGDIKPFTCTASIVSSNTSNTSKYEFTLCDKNKNPIGSPIQTNNSYYNFTGLQEETEYYIRYRVQSKDSGGWSGYVYSPLFKTPADQVRSWVKNNGSWNKGKLYYKQNGEWVKAKKIYIKINGQWVLSINKYD